MAGRPKRQFSDEEVQGIERYARIGSYDRTIAVGMNIPQNTLQRHFGVKIRQWRAAGKLEMRDKLHKQADNSPQTAIFIAKNELGMTDKQVIETKTGDDAVIDEALRAELKAVAARYKLRKANT